jgi:glycerol dehydrogenase-like iron-containing ADH family enzyme
MLTTTIFPGRYVQGPGAMRQLGEEIERFGRRGFLIVDPYVLDNIFPEYRDALEERLEIEVERFGGECSEEEIERLLSRIQSNDLHFVAGIGDALATWFEADSCRQSAAPNMTGKQGSMTAFRLAELCYHTLLEYSEDALTALRAGASSPALEKIIEANTLLSGIGFESGGLAAAHAIHNGLTEAEATHDFYHGEKVAIGVLASLFLTGKAPERIEEVFAFCEQVGLPTTLADIGLDDPSDELLQRIARRATQEGETIHNEPIEITVDRVIDAIRVADREGGQRKSPAVG